MLLLSAHPNYLDYETLKELAAVVLEKMRKFMQQKEITIFKSFIVIEYNKEKS